MATIDGAGDPDSLPGTNDPDTINGAGGNDTISGLGGGDLLHGDNQDDVINGGDGSDLIYGDNDNDRLSGGFGKDQIEDGNGNDSVFGGFGDDTIYIFSGTDTIAGNFGADVFDIDIYASAGDDIDGGFGFDQLQVSYAGAMLGVTQAFGSSFAPSVTLASGLTISSIENFDVDGSNLADRFTGGIYRDEIRGLAGDDTLNGAAGADELAGGSDNDLLSGGAGDDFLDGGLNDDTLNGGEGSDSLYGDSGINIFSGGTGNDRVDTRASEAGSVANGGAGNADELVWSDATNTATLFTAPDPADIVTRGGISFTGFERFSIDGGGGNDTITGGALDDNLFGGDGADILQGGMGRDYLSSGSDAGNVLRGGAGGDEFNSAGKGDTVNGGSGVDSLIINQEMSLTAFNLSVTDSAVTAIASDGTTIVNCERFTIYLGAASLVSINNDDNDYITGSIGNDTIGTGGGFDVISGREGNDRIFGGDDGDTLFGESGTDLLNGGNGDDYLSDDGDIVSADTMNGGAGTDRAFINNAGTARTFDFALTDGTVATGDGRVLISIEEIGLLCGNGNDRVTGGSLGDEILGFDGADTLNGGGGRDQLEGGKGIDRINGEDGGDTLDAGEADGTADTVNGGQGNDWVAISGDGDKASGGAGNDTIELFAEASVAGVNIVLNNGTLTYLGSAFAGFEAISFGGTAGSDTVTGGSLSDEFSDSLGNDHFRGLGGADRFFLGEFMNQSTMDGGAGFDTVFINQLDIHAVIDLANQAMNAGAAKGDKYIAIEQFFLTEDGDRFLGDGNKNFVSGGEGGDELNGRGGDDFLAGGNGSDKLTGGAGRDQFYYFFANDEGDIISDFTRGQDLITINNFGFFSRQDLGPARTPPPEIIVRNGADPQASGGKAQFLFDTDDHRLYFDFDGAGSAEAVYLAYLPGVDSLSSADFRVDMQEPMLV